MQNFTLIPQQGAGRGRLVRVGATVLYSAGDAAAATALIGWCRLVGDRPATEVMSELSRLSAGAASLGPFCAIVIGDHGLDVLMHGGVPLRAQGPAGAQMLSDGQTHLHDVISLDLLFGDAPVDSLLSLDDGVVAADGFSLRAKTATVLPWGPSPTAPNQPMTAEAASAPTPAPAESAHMPAQMVSLREAGADELPAAAPLPLAVPASAPTPAPAPTPVPAATPGPMPAPVAPPPNPALAATAAMPVATPSPAAAPSAGPQPVRVKGLVCARGHFNDPRTRFCATCGIAMHQTSFILTEDVRPPLGVLVMSDGAYHTLITSLVFGRDPDDDPEVREGRAQGVTLIDPGNTISRVHAEIRAVEWDVHIVDHGSTNGTFLWSADRQQWDRLTPNQPMPLQPGQHVAFGRLTATYESSNRQKG
jgi:hypothetical protein